MITTTTIIITDTNGEKSNITYIPVEEFGYTNVHDNDEDDQTRRYKPGTIKSRNMGYQEYTNKTKKYSHDGYYHQTDVFYRHSLTLCDVQYPRVSQLAFVSRGLVTLNRYGDDYSDINTWICTFTPEDSEKMALCRVMDEIYSIVADDKDIQYFSEITNTIEDIDNDDIEDTRVSNKTLDKSKLLKRLIRTRTMSLLCHCDYLKCKDINRNMCQTHPSVVSISVKCGNNNVIVDDNDQPINDWSTLEDKVFMANRYYTITDIITTKEIVVKAQIDKLVVLSEAVDNSIIRIPDPGYMPNWCWRTIDTNCNTH